MSDEELLAVHFKQSLSDIANTVALALQDRGNLPLTMGKVGSLLSADHRRALLISKLRLRVYLNCYSDVFSIEGQRGRERLFLNPDVNAECALELNRDLLEVRDEIVSHLFAQSNGNRGSMPLGQLGGVLSARSHNCITGYKLHLKTFFNLVKVFTVTSLEHGCEVVSYPADGDLRNCTSEPPVAIVESTSGATREKKATKLSAFKLGMPTAFDHPDEIESPRDPVPVPFSPGAFLPPSPVQFVATALELQMAGMTDSIDSIVSAANGKWSKVIGPFATPPDACGLSFLIE
jgi:hypothetical protein